MFWYLKIYLKDNQLALVILKYLSYTYYYLSLYEHLISSVLERYGIWDLRYPYDSYIVYIVKIMCFHVMASWKNIKAGEWYRLYRLYNTYTSSSWWYRLYVVSMLEISIYFLPDIWCSESSPVTSNKIHWVPFKNDEAYII